MMGKAEDSFVAVENAWKFDNLIKLRDHMMMLADPSASSKIGFNMWCFYPTKASEIREDTSVHNCGTVACIAGHAAIISGYFKDTDGFQSTYHLTDHVRKWLRMNDTEFDFLCRNSPLWNYDIDLVTPADAVKVLNYMINTGTMPPQRFIQH